LFTRNTYIDEFSRTDRSFRQWHWLVLAPKLFPKKKGFSDGKIERSNFLRRVRALKYGNSISKNGVGFPNIEVLSVAAGKDISILPFTLRSVLKNSMNPITQITIICPQQDRESCISAVRNLGGKTPIRVLNEDQILPMKVRSEIKKKFPHRYGWVLQQFLATKYISESTSKGVLLINSDTILIKRAHWLNSNGQQILMPSLEFHPPYYKLLENLFQFSANPRHTFITHHMLFQPQKFTRILEQRGFDSVEEFLFTALEQSDTQESSPLCVEFEPYAQGMMIDYNDFVTLRKFSNLGLPRNPKNLQIVEDLIEGRVDLPYNSVSLHDYL